MDDKATSLCTQRDSVAMRPVPTWVALGRRAQLGLGISNLILFCLLPNIWLFLSIVMNLSMALLIPTPQKVLDEHRQTQKEFTA